VRQVALNYKTGAVLIENVSLPALKPGGVLVQSAYSVISTGTEGLKVRQSRMSYLGKARARPDQVRKILHTLRQQGALATYRKVMNKLDRLSPLGYSLSGVVAAVGEGAEEFTVGQRVACAGGGYASHAEVNFVPRNLVVAVPEGVTMQHAAFMTLGAIAMQGFRQAEMHLGESACVIGLGLLGQITVQILAAAGIEVVGVDPIASRCKLAEEHGAAMACGPHDQTLILATKRLTGGEGVDCVLITASGDTNGPVELAARLARDRARVVDIGRVRLDIPFKDYYEKELDLQLSRSYGPGRYDPSYEERGFDYPIGYVRWTERRNMSCFLDLVASGKIHLDSIISAVYPFDDIGLAYRDIAEGGDRLLGAVIRYPKSEDLDRSLPNLSVTRKPKGRSEGSVRTGVIGAGNFSTSVLLPHLNRLADVCLTELATTRGLSGADAARKFPFERTGTDYHALLNAADIDAVIIATRHATHAAMTAEGLRAGKSVFVEKPLAISLADVQLVRRTLVDTGNHRLMVGFNRRFSPYMRIACELFRKGGDPLVMHYRVHAGQVDSGSWYSDISEGSRFVGEAGHFFDAFTFLTGSRPVSILARCLRPGNMRQDDLENVAAVVTYEDGSVGNLLYLTQGAESMPKEHLEIFGAGQTVLLDNFKSLTIFEGGKRRTLKAGVLKEPDKGHGEEMRAFVSAVKLGLEMPIPVEALLDTTMLTLATIESLKTGQPVHLLDLWAVNGS